MCRHFFDGISYNVMWNSPPCLIAIDDGGQIQEKKKNKVLLRVEEKLPQWSN